MTTQATPKDYWISPSALYIELNALNNPDFIQASCVSGAQILVYVKGIIAQLPPMAIAGRTYGL